MIIKTVGLDEIQFVPADPGELTDSIRTRGIAIPVQVNRTDAGYICIDGARRLSACRILVQENEKYGRIPVCIRNDYSKAGSGFWGNTQNHH
ncbi:MAG: ParB-like nuclease domain-containing protein [Solobacterium sp.]|nr:ParB-like nuclease domain-containing protein [Solobacterium sp.]